MVSRGSQRSVVPLASTNGASLANGVYGRALRDFEREARDGRLADARRAVQDHVLRIRRADLREQRLDRRLLSDDLAQRLRAQAAAAPRPPACAARALRALRASLASPAFRGRRVFAQRFELEILEILLVALGHLLVDALVRSRLRRGCCAMQIRHRFFDLGDRFALLRARRGALERRVFEDQTLQRAQPIGQMLRAHHLQRAHLAGAQNELILPEYAAEHLVERGDVAAQLVFDAELAPKPRRVGASVPATAILGRDDVDRSFGDDVLVQLDLDRDTSRAP